MIITLVIIKIRITACTKYYNLVSCIFFTYNKSYSASFSFAASTATTLYQNSCVYCYSFWFWYQKPTRYIALSILWFVIAFCFFWHNLITFDISWYITYWCFQVIVHHLYIMYLHIWPNNIDYYAFVMISGDCINEIFPCKIVLHHCLICCVGLFSHSFFINTLSADIYDWMTGSGH